ncbi:MAG: hypothetical protein ACFFEU_02055 [Candidatus Thorarchaeota archaeon]
MVPSSRANYVHFRHTQAWNILMYGVFLGENVHRTYLRFYDVKHMGDLPTTRQALTTQSKKVRAYLLGGDNLDKLRSYLNGRIEEICKNLRRPEITPYFQAYLNVLLEMYTEFLDKLEDEYAPIEQPF